MAQIHGVAGEWARVKGTVLGLWPLFLGVFLTGLFVAVAATLSLLWGSALAVLSVVFCVWSYVRGLRLVERFFKGARGEERVAGILKSLPETYHVFNNFLAGRHHVDHVVVGPAGIFAVETKFWRGRVTIESGHILVGGQLPSHDPLVQVLKEAEAVRGTLQAKGLTAVVTPVLTFASDTFEAKVAELRGAVIINSNHLNQAFATKQVALPPTELSRLVRLMESDR